MTRNLKGLGLAFVAMFAMFAVAASAAHAEKVADFAATQYPTTLTAEQDPGAVSQVFTTTAGTITCNTVSGEGTLSSETPTLTSTNIKYGSCTGPLGIGVTVNMNGCHYLFKAGTQVGTTAIGTADIQCPAGKTIVITAGGLCTITVAAQTNLGPVKFTNVAGSPHDVTIDAEIADKIVSKHSGFFCGTGEDKTGDYTGKITVKGFTDNAAHEPVGITTTGT